MGVSGALFGGGSRASSWPVLDSGPLTFGVFLKVVRSYGAGNSYTHCFSNLSSRGADFFFTDCVHCRRGLCYLLPYGGQVGLTCQLPVLILHLSLPWSQILGYLTLGAEAILSLSFLLGFMEVMTHPSVISRESPSHPSSHAPPLLA